MNYNEKIKLLDLSISNIKEMLRSQKNYNVLMCENINKELDLIRNKQLDFICDEHLEFVTDEQLDLIAGEEFNLIKEEQLKFDTGKISYRIEKRRYRTEILVKEARYTQIQIMNILMVEFPEYKTGSHNTFLSDLKNPRHYKSENFKKLVVADPMTTILSFG